jgi:sugar O-acyltransferase (sialic acid O-acetyltransferase NeuD family)
MDKPNIIVIGASGHAKVVIDIFERRGDYRITGFIDVKEKVGLDLYGYQVMGVESDLPTLARKLDLRGCFVAIGDNWRRHLVAEKISELMPGLEFVTAIHPSAQIARGATVGRGTVIMAGGILNSDSRVGDFCILNTKAALDHDSLMEDFSSLAPNATAGGNVRIGAYSAVSLGANIIHGRAIGQHSVIGAGAVVLEDIPDFSVAVGVPAKVIRKRNAGDQYL